MLVLTRKVGEEIIIGGNIRIMITEIGNGRVKLGIDAPRDVHIMRSELDAEPALVASQTIMSDDHLERLLASRAKSVTPRDDTATPVLRIRKPR